MPVLYDFWKLSMKSGINKKIVVEHVVHLLWKDVSILQISEIKLCLHYSRWQLRYWWRLRDPTMRMEGIATENRHRNNRTHHGPSFQNSTDHPMSAQA